MLGDDLYRLVIRARNRWRRAEPACSNEASAGAAGERMFVAHDSQGRTYDCFVPPNSQSTKYQADNYQ